MRTFKHVMIVLLIVIVCVLTGYFVMAYTRMGCTMSLEDYRGTNWRSRDGETLLTFSRKERVSLIHGDYYMYFDEYVYSDSIFKFKYGSKEYVMAAMGNDLLYSSDFNVYPSVGGHVMRKAIRDYRLWICIGLTIGFCCIGGFVLRDSYVRFGVSFQIFHTSPF